MKADLLVIGGGAGALSSVYEAQNNGIKNIVIIEKTDSLGGILNQCIHNGFGSLFFKEDLTGPEYAKKLIEKIDFSCVKVYFNTTAVKINFEKRLVYVVGPKLGFKKIFFKALFVATGCYEKSIGSFNIPGTRPAGIMTAGTAQRFINCYGHLPGKNVVIFGTNIAGLTVARRLILEKANVLCVIEPNTCCTGPLKDEYLCIKDYNTPVFYSHTITNIFGKERIEKIEVSKLNNKNEIVKGSNFSLDLDTLLVALDLVPENEIISNNNFIEIDANTQGPIVDQNMETTFPGVYVCGNNVYVHDMVDIIANDAKNIGRSAKKFIEHFGNEISNKKKFLKIKISKDFDFVVPQRINLTECYEDFFEIYLKPKESHKKVKLMVDASGNIIFEKVINNMLPSKIEKILINKKNLVKFNSGEILTYLQLT